MVATWFVNTELDSIALAYTELGGRKQNGGCFSEAPDHEGRLVFASEGVALLVPRAGGTRGDR